MGDIALVRVKSALDPGYLILMVGAVPPLCLPPPVVLDKGTTPIGFVRDILAKYNVIFLGTY